MVELYEHADLGVLTTPCPALRMAGAEVATFLGCDASATELAGLDALEVQQFFENALARRTPIFYEVCG